VRRPLVAELTVLAMVVSACGSGTPTASPVTSPAAPGSTASRAPISTDSPAPSVQPSDWPSEPSSSAEPLPSSPPQQALEPLPEPELTSADEIAELLFDPSWSEQAVVSMLDVLGIGLYNPDGTAIRAGTETTSTDYFVFEPEARGLIDMLLALDEDGGWVNFGDFHAALAGLGYYGGSAEELAQAYAQSYATEPEANVSKLVNGLAYIDVEAPLPRFTAWLMIADAFLDPSSTEAGTARPLALSGQSIAAGPRRGLGVARNRVRGTSPLPAGAQAAVILHLMAVIGRSGVGVSSATLAAHEGHGGEGPSIDFVATVRSAGGQFTNPFPPHQVLYAQQAGNIANVRVEWQPLPSLQRHLGLGGLGSTVTDASGEARWTSFLKAEEANGHGIEIHELGQIRADISSVDLLSQVYGQPALAALVPVTLTGMGHVDITWHELEAMQITITNHYDITLQTGLESDATSVGDDVFSGVLAQQSDGTWVGNLVGTTKGTGGGTFGGRGCTWGWNASQWFIVEAAQAAPPNGPFQLTFHPSGPASGQMGSRRCKPTRWKRDGVLLAPFNDTRITSGGGLNYILPARPGGSVTYDITSGSLTGIKLKDTYWRFEVDYLEPPAP
jgi:hypothetical protein